MVLIKELLDILVCPQCKGAVVPRAQDDALVCPACSLSYPVREGVPVLFAEEARYIGSQR